MLLKRALTNPDLKPELMDVGDVNEDGMINSFDIMLIKKIILENK